MANSPRESQKFFLRVLFSDQEVLRILDTFPDAKKIDQLKVTSKYRCVGLLASTATMWSRLNTALLLYFLILYRNKK